MRQEEAEEKEDVEASRGFWVVELLNYLSKRGGSGIGSLPLQPTTGQLPELLLASNHQNRAPFFLLPSLPRSLQGLRRMPPSRGAKERMKRPTPRGQSRSLFGPWISSCPGYLKTPAECPGSTSCCSFATHPASRTVSSVRLRTRPRKSRRRMLLLLNVGFETEPPAEPWHSSAESCELGDHLIPKVPPYVPPYVPQAAATPKTTRQKVPTVLFMLLLKELQ